MGKIFRFLGLSVGILQMASMTENGRKAFVYEPEVRSGVEEQDQVRLVDRSWPTRRTSLTVRITNLVSTIYGITGSQQERQGPARALLRHHR